MHVVQELRKDVEHHTVIAHSNVGKTLTNELVESIPRFLDANLGGESDARRRHNAVSLLSNAQDRLFKRLRSAPRFLLPPRLSRRFVRSITERRPPSREARRSTVALPRPRTSPPA